MGDAAAFAPQPARLEDVGKVAREDEREREAHRPVAVVAHRDPLVGMIAPEEGGAHDVERVLLQDDALVEIDVGIGEIDAEHRIVVAHVEAEQQRRHAVEKKLEAREEARIRIEQAVGAARRRAHVAMTVEHRKRVAVLEHAARTGGRPGRRNVEGNFRQAIACFRQRDARDAAARLARFRLAVGGSSRARFRIQCGRHDCVLVGGDLGIPAARLEQGC